MEMSVFKAVNKERDYQDQKWGTIEEHGHTVAEWLMIMDEYMNRAKKAWVTQNGDRSALKELLKVVAVGVACMEEHGVVERNQQ